VVRDQHDLAPRRGEPPGSGAPDLVQRLVGFLDHRGGMLAHVRLDLLAPDSPAIRSARDVRDVDAHLACEPPGRRTGRDLGSRNRFAELARLDRSGGDGLGGLGDLGGDLLHRGRGDAGRERLLGVRRLRLGGFHRCGGAIELDRWLADPHGLARGHEDARHHAAARAR
jgi:hypothetical protein